MKLVIKIKSWMQGLSLVLSLTLLVSCTSYLTYKGQEVASQDRLEIKDGGPHHGFWKTYDLSVDYTYEKKADGLQLSGEVNFNKSISHSFDTVDHFDLRVYFMDASGIILDGKGAGLTAAGYRQGIEILKFEKQLPLPMGTHAMAFGYNGTARDHGGTHGSDINSGSTDWSFWKTPVQRRLFN